MTRKRSWPARALRGVLLAMMAAFACADVAAQVPDKLNYQGRLTDPGGTPVTASVPMVFKLYNVGGATLYTEAQTVAVSNGIFNVAIGTVTPINLPFDVPYFLGVTVGADAEMTPRQAVLSNAYAQRADTANTLAASATVGGAQVTGSITVATVPTTQLSGMIGSAQIANNAVTQGKLSPSSGAAAGKVLGTDGSNLQWQTAAGGGTVTNVATGTGLTGGPITASGTINLVATQLLPTVACASGRVPNWNGSAWVCGDPSTFAGNLTLPESTAASVGNIMKGATRFIHNYGLNNTFVGEDAGNFAMPGYGNSALGSGALSSNTSGVFNTASGGSALVSNTSGSYNTASGGYALSSNATGDFNTASGHAALSLNTTGSRNTASGGEALLSNTTGINNTAGGFQALHSNTVGQDNTAHGAYALYSNTTDYQTAVGAYALYSNLTGGLNTAVGANALYSNTTGQNNVATGVNALRLNTIGTDNTSAGNSALTNNDSGAQNTAIGSSAMLDNTNGFNNVALGYEALRKNTTGVAHTAIGYRALFQLTTETGNTGVGYFARVDGNNSTAVGREAYAIGNNATALGHQALTDASDRVRIGNTSVTQIGGQVAWSNLSDRREKKDITDSSLGLDFIKALRPVQFKLLSGNDRTDFGFIAQEVEALLGTGYNVLGIGGTAERKLSLRYTDFIAPMVKAIQQQQAMIEEQRAVIARQQARLDQQLEMAVAEIAEVKRQRALHAAELAELRRTVDVLLAVVDGRAKVAAFR